MKFCEYNIISF